VALLAELVDRAAAGGDQPLLGEALLHARRRALARGEAAALCLVSFGDVDWRLRTGAGHTPK
jgi:hypothetical protein